MRARARQPRQSSPRGRHTFATPSTTTRRRSASTIGTPRRIATSAVALRALGPQARGGQGLENGGSTRGPTICTLVMSSKYSKSCGNVIFSSSHCSATAVALVALIAHVTTRFDVSRRLAQKRDGEPFAHRFVVNAKGRRVQDLDAVRGIVGVENRNGEVVAIDDVDRSDNERILGREELMTTLVPRGNLVKDAMPNETAQDLAQRRDRGERFRPITAACK